MQLNMILNISLIIMVLFGEIKIEMRDKVGIVLLTGYSQTALIKSTCEPPKQLLQVFHQQKRNCHLRLLVLILCGDIIPDKFMIFISPIDILFSPTKITL